MVGGGERAKTMKMSSEVGQESEESRVETKWEAGEKCQRAMEEGE